MQLRLAGLIVGFAASVSCQLDQGGPPWRQTRWRLRSRKWTLNRDAVFGDLSNVVGGTAVRVPPRPVRG